MKRFLYALLLGIGCIVGANAQTYTSPNLSSLSNSQVTLSGTTPIDAVGGYSGGGGPGHISSTNTIVMSYMTGTAAYRYAFTTALQNSGITFLGYNYSWDYYNQDLNRGTLSATIDFASTSGTILHSNTIQMGQTTQGWTAMSGNTVFANNLLAANISSLGLSFTGKDDRWWAGYYGPMVRNASLTLNYTFDTCSSNPLSSPSCPGYAQAYHDQQCAANPLYATTCSGYAAAYQTQQCTINPLYSAQCPGYAEAFKTQQCTANPLYATDCAGYAEAYKAQQCNLNGLYDRSCPNYAEAYAKANLLPANTTPNNTTPAPTPVVAATSTAAVETGNPAAAAISDPMVKSAVVTNDTISPTSPTSVTSVISAAPAPAAPGPAAKAVEQAAAAPQPAPAAQQERAAENKKTENAVASVERRAGGNPTAARAAATERARELAREAGNAKTLEAQAATQGQVVGLMAFVPGFTAYQNALVPDTLGAQVAKQYAKPTVDNRSAQRQLSGRNELRWQEMVDSQYRGK